MHGTTFWHPQSDILSSISTPAAEKFQQIPASSAFWNMLAGGAKQMTHNFDKSGDQDRWPRVTNTRLFVFFEQYHTVLFSLYCKDVKCSVWHSCAEAWHFTLNRWFRTEVVWEEQGFSSSFDLLNFLTFFFFAFVTPFGFSHRPCSMCSSHKVHNVRTVCCWTHLDLVQRAANKSSAWKACSGCQWHPICYSGIVEHSGAAVILLL